MDRPFLSLYEPTSLIFMLKKVLTGKIHQARITQCDLEYVGSITIDEDLLRATGMVANEFVNIADLDNGARFETYVIKGEAGSGIIGINGAAAHLVSQGDRIIIFSMAQMTDTEISHHVAQVVVCDEQNRIEQRLEYPCSLDATGPVAQP
jgi:aspartate 1-decarboxylase